MFDEREAEWIVEAATGLDRAGQAVEGDTDLPMESVDRALALAERRAGGEPLQYVTGIAGFRHIELSVGPGTFIPRPETELVAERAMERLPLEGVAVDVGTGSGAISLAIAHERPDAGVYATEVSADALAWATKNRDALDLPVRLIQCNLLDGLPADLRERVDVVVANPPYVPRDEASLLPRDVVEHEPHVALFAPGDPLSAVRAIADAAVEWLRRDGWLVLELGAGQGERVRAILAEAGYDDISILPDRGGRTRVAEGRRP